MAGYDLYVAGEVGFKGEDLGRLAGCLPADNGANLGGYSVLDGRLRETRVRKDVQGP